MRPTSGAFEVRKWGDGSSKLAQCTTTVFGNLNNSYREFSSGYQIRIDNPPLSVYRISESRYDIETSGFQLTPYIKCLQTENPTAK